MEQPNRRRIAANFVTLAVTNVIGLLTTIIISVYIRRILGPVAIGQYSWALAVVAYAGILVNTGGLTAVAQRHASHDPKQCQHLMSVVITLQMLAAGLAYLIIIGIALLNLRGSTVNTLLLIQGLTVFCNAWSTAFVLQANERMVVPSIAALVINAMQIPILFVVIHGPSDVYLYATVPLLALATTAVYNLWYISRMKMALLRLLRPRLTGAMTLLHEAWPLVLAAGAGLVMLNTHTIVLGFTDGDAAVGQFNTALRLMMVAMVITSSMWMAYFASLTRSSKVPQQAVALSKEFLGLLAWMGMPIAFLGWTFGRHVVQIMYGTQFWPAGPYFEWLCLAIGLNFLSFGLQAVLMPWGKGYLQLRINGAGLVINLLVCLTTIPTWGAWGAVAATLAGEAAILLASVLVRRNYNIFWHPIWPIIAPPLLCSAAVAGVIASLPSEFDERWWIVELIISITILAGCLAWFERAIIRRVLRILLKRDRPVGSVETLAE